MLHSTKKQVLERNSYNLCPSKNDCSTSSHSPLPLLPRQLCPLLPLPCKRINQRLHGRPRHSFPLHSSSYDLTPLPHTRAHTNRTLFIIILVIRPHPRHRWRIRILGRIPRRTTACRVRSPSTSRVRTSCPPKITSAAFASVTVVFIVVLWGARGEWEHRVAVGVVSCDAGRVGFVGEWRFESGVVLSVRKVGEYEA